MKRNTLWMALLAILTVMTGCGGNSQLKHLLEQVPEDTDIVLAGDLKTLIESAGGTVDGTNVTIPSFITDELGKGEAKELDEVLDMVKNGGVDPRGAVVFGSFEGRDGTVVLGLSDADKFKKLLDNEGFKEKDDEDGILYFCKKDGNDYYETQSWVGIKGDIAYFMADVWNAEEKKPAKQIAKYAEAAKEKNFASTPFADYICKGNVGGMAVKLPRELRSQLREQGLPSNILDNLEGTICIRGDVNDDSAALQFCLFDPEGKVRDQKDFNPAWKGGSKISKKALAYMGKDIQFVAAASLKDFDWDTFTETAGKASGMNRSQVAAMSIATSYLQNLNGTLAFGVGLNGGLAQVMNLQQDPTKAIALTLVAETKEDKAKKLMNDLKALLETTGMPFNEEKDGFTVSLPGSGSLSVMGKGNMLVISTQPIKEYDDSPAIKALDFGEYTSAMALALNKTNPIMEDLGLDYDIKLLLTGDNDKCEGELKLVVEGGKGGIMEKLFRIGIDLGKKGQAMSSASDEMDFDSEEMVAASTEEYADSTAFAPVAVAAEAAEPEYAGYGY